MISFLLRALATLSSSSSDGIRLSRGLRQIAELVYLLHLYRAVKFQQAERINPKTNIKKAIRLTMIPTTGTHLFTPPSSDKVSRKSPEGFDILTLVWML
jgi:hypothetical protein